MLEWLLALMRQLAQALFPAERAEAVAVLSAAERQKIRNAFMRLNTEQCAFTKADIQAAVDATDTWIDGQQSAFNTALPVTFRNNASLSQKTLLFCFTAMRRAGLLATEGN